MSDRKETMHIPQHETEAIARCLLPDILKYYESEEGQREFDKWKRDQTENCINSKTNTYKIKKQGF